MSNFKKSAQSLYDKGHRVTNQLVKTGQDKYDGFTKYEYSYPSRKSKKPIKLNFTGDKIPGRVWGFVRHLGVFDCLFKLSNPKKKGRR